MYEAAYSDQMTINIFKLFDYGPELVRFLLSRRDEVDEDVFIHKFNQLC